MAQITEGVQKTTEEWREYFGEAQARFLQECCFQEGAVREAGERGAASGVWVLHLNTSDKNNVLAETPGFNTLLKSVFLMNPSFRKNIIGYYRSMGFAWVDLICLNRDNWKIFLWPNK